MGTLIMETHSGVLQGLVSKRSRVLARLTNLSAADRDKDIREYNAQAKRYNFLVMWEYLTKRHADGQGWCSYSQRFLPADPDKPPYLVLRLERRPILGGTTRREYAHIYMTPNIATRDEKIGGEFKDARLPVRLIGDPPERTEPDVTNGAGYFYGQHTAWLDHAKRSLETVEFVFPTEIELEEAERYSTQPLLELIKTPV